MTEVMSYNQQSNFASVIQNINRELQQKGELSIASLKDCMSALKNVDTFINLVFVALFKLCLPYVRFLGLLYPFASEGKEKKFDS